MQNKYPKFWLWFLLFIFPAGLMAQESINTSGGEASGSGGEASYSVGQILYQTNTSANGSVMEGVQMPYEIFVVETQIEKTSVQDMSITAYPNPATDFLTLDLKDSKPGELHFYLYSLDGSLLQNKKITSTRTLIDMAEYSPSTYFIRVLEGKKEVKKFKIVKNK